MPKPEKKQKRREANPPRRRRRNPQTHSTASLATRARGIRCAHGARCARGIRYAHDDKADNEARRQKQATTRSRRDAPSARSQARAPACSSPLPPWAELSSREHDRRRARADKARSAFAFPLKATRRPRRFSAAAAAAAPASAETIATNAEIAYAYPPSTIREGDVAMGERGGLSAGGWLLRLRSQPSPTLWRSGPCCPQLAHAKARHLDYGVAPYPPAWGD